MRTMSNLLSDQRSLSASEQSPAYPPLRARRFECQHCSTHTFLVLRTIGDAKCSVCESHDLAPVED
jgi:hypothetical protein